MSSTAGEVAGALPEYEVDAPIGRGQYGVVWRGHHRRLERPVAIKQLAEVDDGQSARFRREARLLAQLDHPHVVSVYDYREAGDLRLLVMEFLAGGTLAERIGSGISVESAVASALAAAAGLHHVHELGVLHRDVKPENLMFDRRGALKITDFGVARDVPSDAAALTLTSDRALMGTPAYASPEQAGRMLAEGWPAPTAASDQYSLAAVLYHALSGELTHDATGGVVGLCTRRMNEEARPLRSIAPEVPQEIADVVMAALARDPTQRYPTTEAFGVALADAARRSLGAGWLERSNVDVRSIGPILTAATGHPSGAQVDPQLAATTDLGLLGATPHLPARPAPAMATTTTPATEDRAPTTVRARDGEAGNRRSRRVLIALIIALSLALTGVAAALVRRASTTASSAGAGAPSLTKARLASSWAFPTGGPVYSSPSAADGLVVVGSDDNAVYGLDARTGARRWKRVTEGEVQSSPAIAGNRAYVGSNDGNLYALDTADGSVAWQVRVGFEIVSSPAIDSGLVIVGSDKLYAFDAATGEKRWAFAPGAPIASSPAIANGIAVVGSNDQEIYGISLADGSRLWHVRTDAEVQSSPTIANGIAYVGGLDGFLRAIAVATGNEEWAIDLGAGIHSSPAVSEGAVVVGTDAGALIALEADDGDRRWEAATGRSVWSSPLAVPGGFIVGSNDRSVHLMSTTGKALDAFETGGAVRSSGTLAGDTVVIGSDDKKVYALRVVASP